MLDHISIQFDPATLWQLNLVIAFMMFGVALSLKVSDFTYVLKRPIAPVIGLIAQFVLLPALTYAATRILPIDPSLALGMILVASCPGGNFSNLMTYLARGNVAVSVSMTAISSLAALIMTPLNFAFWASLNPATSELLSSINVGAGQMVIIIGWVLVLPLIAGMWLGQQHPKWSGIIEPWLRRLSLLVLAAFVIIAFSKNLDIFWQYMHVFAALVIGHNALALLLGFGLASAAKLTADDRKAVTLETGIQNSGLALIVLFNFFPEQGGMMIIAAFWGVWHLVSGSLLALYWGRNPKLATSS